MAKRTPTKTRSSFWRSQLRYWAYHRLLGLFTLAVLVLLVAWGVYAVQQEFQKHTERQNFAHAQKDINDIYRAIAKNVGQPSVHKAVQTCSYTSVEIGRGARSCEVHEYIVYSAKALTEAQGLTRRVASMVSSLQSTQSSSNSMNDPDNIRTDGFSIGTLQCNADYWYFEKGKLPYPTPSFATPISTGIFIDLSCGGGAKAEYYPVVNS